jgi:catechol 2,3-dioxygenase-like lactoylglutathione lyase family enzyme
MDYQIQVVTVPVTDVDQAAAFYTQQAGFALDVDYHPAGDFRVVQLTPPGWQPGTDPERRDYASFADFTDPDGNTWVLQEIGYRGPASARGLPG